MNERERETQASGWSVGDIYYVLFRQKWKILGLSLLGIGAAAAVFLATPPVYVSEAKLFVLFVQDSRVTFNVLSNDTRLRTPDTRGDNIINSELEILSSMDLAFTVVTNI